VFISAAVTGVMLAALSWLTFGPDVWDAFLRSIPAANRLNFELGGAGWNKWQNTYGAARAFGASATVAWTIYGAVSVAVAAIVIALWRSKTAFDLKAGALAAGALAVDAMLKQINAERTKG
jgi:hypothetical protein